MDIIGYSAARANLKNLMDRVVETSEEVVITRSSGASVVMVSLDDWKAQQETNYLLSSPKNAERLRASVAEMDAGGGIEVGTEILD